MSRLSSNNSSMWHQRRSSKPPTTPTPTGTTPSKKKSPKAILLPVPPLPLPLPLLLLLLLSKQFLLVKGHGYLKTPRSRNLVAFQEAHYDLERSEDFPMPEDCPHCLNHGGTLAQCGINSGIDPQTSLPWERNYDHPQNSLGGPMKPLLQATYTEGQTIEVEVMVTTHHKGHFEFKACSILPLLEDTQSLSNVRPASLDTAPTAECFLQNKLTFVEDVLYGAPPDPNHPERAYIAPASIAQHSNGLPKEQPVRGAIYKMKLQLPKGLTGEVVLLQWYYLTANSCKHEGYESYEFPESWGEDVKLYPGLPDCGEIPKDGAGVPEQFWNCAEIKIERSLQSTTTISSSSSSSSEPEFQANALLTSTSTTDQTNQEVHDTSPSPSDDIIARQAQQELCPDATYNYYAATSDCSGYVYCTAGTPGQEYPCGGGMLYDQDKQSCNWENEVNCRGSVLSQTQLDMEMESNGLVEKVPTQSPVKRVNPLLEWSGETIRDHDKTIIGYYASWQWYDRDGLAAPINMDFSKITRANFAFFQITTDGDIYGTDSWADPITLFGPYDWMSDPKDPSIPKYCSWDTPDEPPVCSSHNYKEGLIYLAHQAGAEVYPSIGGWSLSDPFPAMAANPVSRENFAKNCVELIKNYNFDGIDIDWEYPGYADHSGTPADTVNFNLLLDEIRKHLDALGAERQRYYGLTAALPCGPSIIAFQDIAHVSSVLTELNLMTYDFHGTWNAKTGVNAPLYDQIDSPEFSAHGCVQNWLKGGASIEKMNIGLPFYGRSFSSATELYGSHDGPDMSTFFEDEGSPQYFNIVKNLGKMTSYRDDQTMTQYAVGKTGLVSYDDERAICDKAQYAIDNNMNGFIIWEISGDLMPDLSTPLLDVTNAKLLDPNLDCATDLAGVIVSNSASGGGPKEPDIVYYPMYDSGTCVADGLHPDWMQPGDLFSSAEDCCKKHFSWNDSCGSDSPAPNTSGNDNSANNAESSTTTSTTSTTTSSSTSSTSSSTTMSTTTTSTSSTSSTAKSTTTSTTSTTSKSTVNVSAPTNDIVSNGLQVNLNSLFYPVFNSEGGATHCENGGSPADWVTPSMLKETRDECCEEFAFEWHQDECKGFLTDSGAASFYSDATERYFPDFHMLQCVQEASDTPESWMTEDYYRGSLNQCCEDFFSKAVSFSSCAFYG